MNRKTAFLSMTAVGAMIALAADDAAATGAGAPNPTPAPVLDPIAKFTFPNVEGERSLDVRTLPDALRLDLLKGAVRNYIANRVNGVAMRHAKDEGVIAWARYDEAQKADSLQSAVPQPATARPAEPDFEKAYTDAIEALKTGAVRKVGDGEGRKRVNVDPLVKAVTGVVVDAVFKNGKALDNKYTYIDARKAVGGDGIAYLNKMIDAKVEGGGDRAALEKMRDENYITPAKIMLGLTPAKKGGELASIL